MPKLIQTDNSYSIILNLRHSFIKKFDLMEFLNTSHITYYVDLSTESNLTTTFWPDIKLANKDFPFYLDIYKQLCFKTGLSEQQAGELLFLSKIYPSIVATKHNEIYNKEPFLKKNGKLLVELIKVPIKTYTLSDILVILEDEVDDVEQTILMYLSMVTDKDPRSFIDYQGNLLLQEIDDDLADKLIEKFIVNRNYCIQDNEHETRSFVVKSRDLQKLPNLYLKIQ